MTVRHYRMTSERMEGQLKSAIRLTCRCGVSHAISVSKTGGLPPEFVEKKFRQLGWVVGTNENRDTCPGCANKTKQKELPALKIVASSEPAPTAAPREMSRDDRRIIFEKLNEVYLDEKRGYDGGWSDHRVATDLGVPRKWVETLRVEMFGDNAGNEDTQAFLTEAQSLLAEARNMLLEAREHRKKIEDLISAMPPAVAINQVSDKLGRLERLASEVRKLVP